MTSYVTVNKKKFQFAFNKNSILFNTKIHWLFSYSSYFCLQISIQILFPFDKIVTCDITNSQVAYVNHMNINKVILVVIHKNNSLKV